MKKKIIAIILVLLVLAGIGAGVYYFLHRGNKISDEKFVYVQSMEDILGYNIAGGNRYMGIVEAQETKGVQKDSAKKIKEIFVEVEDVVEEGDKLFEYDTDEMSLELKRKELEISSLYNEINSDYEQINNLDEMRAAAPDEKKAEYTAQIQSLQVDINKVNYDISDKQLEIDKLNKDMANSVVFAPMSGIIKEIKNDGTSGGSSTSEDYGGYDDYDGYSGGSSDSNSNAFISIMANGQYRIKGTGDEMTLGALGIGAPVLIRSRIDETVTWKGEISIIDREHPENSNNSYDMYGGGGAEKATKYPFYIELESAEGLMLGQHVYIENDYGQGQASGIWLYDYFIVHEDGANYVWVEKDGKIEKREVMLGEFDSDIMTYEITAGLSMDDYIAFPDDRIVEGMRTTRSYDESLMTDMQSQMGMDDQGNFIGGDGFDDGFATDTDGISYEFDDSDMDNMDFDDYDMDDFDEDMGEEGIDDESLDENDGDMGEPVGFNTTFFRVNV